jgi:hypothetical protein
MIRVSVAHQKAGFVSLNAYIKSSVVILIFSSLMVYVRLEIFM